MSREQLLTRLKTMLPAQLREVAFRYGLDSGYIPHNAAPVEIAMLLIQTAEGKKDLAGLADKIQALFSEQTEDLSLRVQAGRGAVSPGLSMTLQSEAEHELVRALLAQYRTLPDGARVPEMLDKLGKLGLAIGDFPQAGELFGELAEHSPDTLDKATALYNRHRAALEQENFAAALEFLLHAAQLAPAQFGPFPLRRYRPEKILGAGGFGTAFLCADTFSNNEPVVIKTLLSEQLARDIGEIFREAHLLKQLEHPRIIKILHWDFADGLEQTRPYLVLEYFRGQSLQAYIEQHGPLSLDEAQALARLLAETLHAAHAQNILHRDLKPANLLVRKDADAWDLKLIDFGLGVRQQPGRGLSLLGRSLAGTFNYAPPEQTGELIQAVGPYSDLYSFGRTFCYALFLNANPTPRQWRELGAHPLVDVLEACIEREPQARLQSALEIQNLLAVPAPEPEPAPRRGITRPAPGPDAFRAWVPAILLLLLVGGGFYFSGYLKTVPPAGDNIASNDAVRQGSPDAAPRNPGAVAPPPSPDSAGAASGLQEEDTPPAVSLKLGVNIDGATVTLHSDAQGERVLGTTPLPEQSLVPDYYTLRVEKLDYLSVEQHLDPAHAPWNLNLTLAADDALRRQKQLAADIKQCRDYLNTGYLTYNDKHDNAQDTAFACYQAVLEEDPGNADAEAGLQAIADKYAAWVVELVAKQNYAKAEKYVEEIRLLRPAQATTAAKLVKDARDAADNPEFRDCPECPLMVRIPGGNYALGKYEVTVGEFKAFVRDTKYSMKSGRWCDWNKDKFAENDRQPVQCISGNDAVAYTEWLSKKTGKGYRLPSESQWEQAARAGSKSDYSLDKQGREVTEHNLGEYAWYSSNSGDKTHPVGEKKANAFSLHDMHGNVWEWVEDKQKYGNSPLQQVFLGGSWDNGAGACIVANRTFSESDYRTSFLGFRLARTYP